MSTNDTSIAGGQTTSTTQSPNTTTQTTVVAPLVFANTNESSLISKGENGQEICPKINK